MPIIGGLGGLNRSIASWLVENRARHLIFLFHSARKVTKDDLFVQEWASQRFSTQKISRSVVNAADVARVVSSAAKPVAEILQAAMFLSVSKPSTMYR